VNLVTRYNIFARCTLNFKFTYLLKVGAGSAGSVIANRLTEDEDVNVLLIEAGGSELNNDNIRIPLHAASLQMSNEDWAYYTVPQKHSQWAMNEQVFIINYNLSSLRRRQLTSSSNKPIVPVIRVYCVEVGRLFISLFQDKI